MRIADLGIAFAAGDVLDERYVADRGRSNAYTRAPDVCLGVTERACPPDIWALGVTTISLVSGSELFLPVTDSGAPRSEECTNALVLAAQVKIFGPIQE